MKVQHLIALLQTNYQTIRVQFKDPYTGVAAKKEYAYKAPMDFDLVIGDEVIVESPSTGMTVVIVSGLDGFASIDLSKEWTYKWVVQKVEKDSYRNRLELEKEAFKTFQRVKAIAARDKAMAEINNFLGDSEEAVSAFKSMVEQLAK